MKDYMTQDTTYRHLVRISKDEFIKKWEESKTSYLPVTYSKEFLQLDKFCTENNWTFKEGLIFLSNNYYEDQVVKSREELERINNFK
jgi:hypothetical protein